jgi:hypothetical protein
MNSLSQYDSLQFGTVVGQSPYKHVPAGSRQILNVISKDVNVAYVMELSEPHTYASLSA